MKNKIHQIESISKLHELMGLPKPKHPLISLIDASKLFIDKKYIGEKFSHQFYKVALKDASCGIEYGRNSLDFNEGVLVFSSPGQVYKPTESFSAGKLSGWMLCVHPDFFLNSHLANSIEDYSFFNYEVHEALHLSEDEEKIINQTVKNIQLEYEQRIDNHSLNVIVSNLALLLNYSQRFYERQFNTRISKNKDIVSRFEKHLKQYFKNDDQQDKGIPSITFFAEKEHLSTHYFSDLIKKEIGRSPKDLINEYIISLSKNLLLSSEDSVSEIAYTLGFNYPHYFSRLFKAKTGKSPVEYRKKQF